MIEASFSLLDHDGRRVGPETYRGRWMLVFFGFTHCKVVCPRNLAKLSAVLDGLGPAADAELAVDGDAVVHHGLGADAQGRGDVLVGAAAGDQAEHVELALGELEPGGAL